MEQSGDLHPQRPQSAAIPGTLRRGHHPQPEEQRLHLPDHLCQGEPTFFLFTWAIRALCSGFGLTLLSSEVSLLELRRQQERGPGDGSGPKREHHTQLRRSLARGDLL